MLQHSRPRLILASASASRRALLMGAGLTFTVRPADIDEAEVKREARAAGDDAAAAAERLAELKARTVAANDSEALVIGADQILVCDGVWFDKPVGVSAAEEQLRALRGRAHLLATAVVCREGGRPVWHYSTSPRLVMRRFSDEFLTAYLAAEGSNITNTVGAYRVESVGVHLFESIEGDYATVLGLPLLPLLAFLRRRGLLTA